MNGIVKLAAAIALGLAGTGAAQAGHITYTFKGTVGSFPRTSTDVEGIFGDAGASLSGLDAVIKFTVDSNPAYLDVDPADNGPNYTVNGFALPPGSVTVTINGHSLTQSWSPSDPTGGDYLLVATVSGDPTDLYSPSALFGNGNFIFSTGVNLSDPAFPGSDINTAFSSYALTPDNSTGSFLGFKYDNVPFNLNMTSLSSTGNVPEPASWTMMVAGFGLAGAAMRRRAVRSVA